MSRPPSGAGRDLPRRAAGSGAFFPEIFRTMKRPRTRRDPRDEGEGSSLDVAAIIRNALLVTHFHPIVNVKTRRTVGLEALVRGVDPASGRLIPPELLFEEAERAHLGLELDRAARKSAFRAYRAWSAPGKPLLFVNVNASILDRTTLGSNHFIDAVRSEGIDPAQVAIEVVESKIENPDHLAEFTSRHRELGILIVIDDFGAKHSNLLRLNDIRPDIIKIDRGFVTGVHADRYKSSIIASIADLAQKNGALCLAEGVESEEELTACYLLRADLFQGYYFGTPSGDIAEALERAADGIDRARPAVEKALAAEIEANRRAHDRLRELVAELGGKISERGAVDEGCEATMADFLARNREAACSYLLDRSGIQITDTVWRTGPPQRRLMQLFQPAPKGFDHSLKSYFVNLRTKDEFFSDSYISLATGNQCRTLATWLSLPRGSRVILCVDFEEGQ